MFMLPQIAEIVPTCQNADGRGKRIKGQNGCLKRCQNSGRIRGLPRSIRRFIANLKNRHFGHCRLPVNYGRNCLKFNEFSGQGRGVAARLNRCVWLTRVAGKQRMGCLEIAN